jgi:hypothetical protein
MLAVLQPRVNVKLIALLRGRGLLKRIGKNVLCGPRNGLKYGMIFKCE